MTSRLFSIATAVAVAVGAFVGISPEARQAHAVPSASMIIDGDTFANPFSFSNTSDAGEFLVGFGIDLTGAASALCFDTAVGGPCNDITSQGAGQFSAASGAAATGLVSSPTVADGATAFTLAFTDFDPGETFSFDIDVDFAGAGSVTVLGNHLIGATAFFDFSDGQRLLGTFAAVAGNSDASAFVVTGVTNIIPLPGALPLLLGALALFGVGGVARRRMAAA